MLKTIGITFVLLMALLQAFYGIYSLLEPTAFAITRGTLLAASADSDWVQIYGSRTLFIALIIATLLYYRHYKLLMWAALFGTVMPITDGWLAYQAGAATTVIAKHLATLVYLLATSVILAMIARKEDIQ